MCSIYYFYFFSYLSLDNFRIDGEWNLKVRKVNFFLNGNEGFCSIDSVWNFHNDQLHQVIKFLSFFFNGYFRGAARYHAKFIGESIFYDNFIISLFFIKRQLTFCCFSAIFYYSNFLLFQLSFFRLLTPKKWGMGINVEFIFPANSWLTRANIRLNLGQIPVSITRTYDLILWNKQCIL